MWEAPPDEWRRVLGVNLDVADEALAAVAEGRFVALRDEWRDAVRRRGERLAAGLPPTLPAPAPPP